MSKVRPIGKHDTEYYLKFQVDTGTTLGCVRQVEGRCETRIGLIVAGGGSAKLFQALEAVFNQIPPLAHFDIVGGEWLSMSLRWDNGERAPLYS
jgi:hypothetical protein